VLIRGLKIAGMLMTNIRETSLRALEENEIKLGIDQQLVYEAIIKLGPTYDNRILEYLRQKEAQKSQSQRRKTLWEKSDITGRRNQLMRKCQIGNEGLIVNRGQYFGRVLVDNKWHFRSYQFWAVRNDSRPVPTGWYSNIEDVPGYKKPVNVCGCDARKKETLF
jgi:hypothetical protein